VQVAPHLRKLDALSSPPNPIQSARKLPNLELFEFQWLSENLQMESGVSFSHQSIPAA